MRKKKTANERLPWLINLSWEYYVCTCILIYPFILFRTYLYISLSLYHLVIIFLSFFLSLSLTHTHTYVFPLSFFLPGFSHSFFLAVIKFYSALLPSSPSLSLSLSNITLTTSQSISRWLSVPASSNFMPSLLNYWIKTTCALEYVHNTISYRLLLEEHSWTGRTTFSPIIHTPVLPPAWAFISQ